MPNAPQPLSDQAQSILRTILDRKLVRGGELLSSVPTTNPEDLIDPIKELLNSRLIEASGLGGNLNAETILFATFGVLPSAERYLRELVKW
jgi:hypothetical protein